MTASTMPTRSITSMPSIMTRKVMSITTSTGTTIMGIMSMIITTTNRTSM